MRTSCSWCCGDLRPASDQASPPVVCVYCGRTAPAERQYRRHANPRNECADESTHIWDRFPAGGSSAADLWPHRHVAKVQGGQAAAMSEVNR